MTAPLWPFVVIPFSPGVEDEHDSRAPLPVMVKPFRLSAMLGAPNEIQGVATIVQVTLPTKLLMGSVIVSVVVSVPEMSMALAAPVPRTSVAANRVSTASFFISHLGTMNVCGGTVRDLYHGLVEAVNAFHVSSRME